MRTFKKNLVTGLLSTLLVISFICPTNSIFAQTFDCFTVTPDTLEVYVDFFDVVNSSSPFDSLFINVDDCGDTGLYWIVSSNTDWAIPDIDHGWDSQIFTVWVDYAGLPEISGPPPEGDTLLFEAVITVDPDASLYEAEQVVLIVGIYNGSSAYELVAAPPHIDIAITAGELYDGSIYLYEKNNKPLWVSYENNAEWLQLPTMFAPLQTPTMLPYHISTVRANGNLMPPGIYIDTLHLYGFAQDDSLSVVENKVEFVMQIIESSSALVVAPDAFNYYVNEETIFNDSFFVDSKDVDLPYCLEFSNQSNWLSLPNFLTPPSTPINIEFTVNTFNLPPGLYLDEIIVYGYPCDNRSLMQEEAVIPVKLFIDNNNNIVVKADPSTFEFNVATGDQILDSFLVFETHNQQVPFHYENKLSWLNLFDLEQEPPLMTPGKIHFQAVVTDDIASGIYYDTVLIYNPLDGDSSLYEPLRVPITILVNSEIPVIQTIPKAFDFSLEPGQSLTGVGFNVFEQSGAEIPFWVDILKGEWLTISPTTTVIPVTPDSVFFEIHTGNMAPGFYEDTIVIYDPRDGNPWFYEVKVPVTIHINGESNISVHAQPAELVYDLEWGDFGIGSFHVYEQSNQTVQFTVQHTQSWLQLDPFGLGPYYTPETIKATAFADDSLLPGIYHDIITISPSSDFNNFPVLEIPVTMQIRDHQPILGDSLVIASLNIKPYDSITYVLPVKTRTTQAVKGVTIPFEIPEGIHVCSLSTAGLITENWDFDTFDVNNLEGYFFAMLANTFNDIIPPGENTVLNVYFTADPFCRDDRVIYWDTTFSDDPSRKLAFAGQSYSMINPGYDKYRNPTTIIGYTPGDYNNDGNADIGDLVSLVEYAFSLRPFAPSPYSIDAMDVNADCIGPDIADIVYIVDWTFLDLVSEALCGCISFNAPLKNGADDNYSISTTYENNVTSIHLTSPSAVRGVQLELSMNPSAEIFNTYSGSMDLYKGYKNDLIKIGLFDNDGNNSIGTGDNVILQIEGEVQVVSAALSGNNYTTIYPSLGTNSNLPAQFELSQNYPNPFNPITRISFTLPTASNISFEIFNINGQRVRTLSQDFFEAGVHSVIWDGTDDNGLSVASGIYLYRLSAGDLVESKKMMLLK